MSFPLPPPAVANTPTSTTGQAIMEVAVALAVVLVVGIAFRLRAKHNTWVPVALAAGALVSAFVEPLPDVTAQLWYFAPKQHTIYTAFGNPFPVWTWFTYLVFYGGLGMLFWWLVEKGYDRRRLALLCVPLFLYLGAAELFMINVMKVYTYYGKAAFVVAHYPVWIPFMNVAIVMLIGTGAARIRRSLPTRDQVVPALLLPGVAMIIGLFLVPCVLWTAVHTSDPSTGLVYLATVATIALAVGVIRSALLLIPSEGFGSLARPEALEEIVRGATVDA